MIVCFLVFLARKTEGGGDLLSLNKFQEVREHSSFVRMILLCFFS